MTRTTAPSEATAAAPAEATAAAPGRPATAVPAPPAATGPARPAAPPARTVAVTSRAVAAYRAAARHVLSAPATAAASPVHAFVLAHTLAEETVARLTAGEPDPVSVVHLAQDIRLTRPVRAGEEVTVSVEVTGLRQETRGARVALRARLTGPDSPAPFAELAISALLSGATRLASAGDITGPAAPRTVPAPDGGQSARHELTAGWIRAYAHASGDLNPIHLDDEAARAAGFPTVIAHGMGVVALAVEEAVDRFAGGDASRVTGLGCRFAAPVSPGVPLDIVLEPDATGSTVRVTCRTPSGIAVKAGWITLAPGEESAS